MAGICTKFAGKANLEIMELACDSQAEIADAPTTTTGGTGVFATYDKPIPMGSTLVVGNEGGEILIYMLFSFGWKQM